MQPSIEVILTDSGNIVNEKKDKKLYDDSGNIVASRGVDSSSNYINDKNLYDDYGNIVGSVGEDEYSCDKKMLDYEGNIVKPELLQRHIFNKQRSFDERTKEYDEESFGDDFKGGGSELAEKEEGNEKNDKKLYDDEGNIVTLPSTDESGYPNDTKLYDDEGNIVGRCGVSVFDSSGYPNDTKVYDDEGNVVATTLQRHMFNKQRSFEERTKRYDDEGGVVLSGNDSF
ncbi:hypothetical protein TrVE_jg13177 [Triparma verrucosa]|uniref:Uncharacterized protein n=1 Tax=Triparma verrucosa TaxID=1606542 RepID=A0A9W7ESE3_9STRA|nr:hypothetical protein TrVE_jg13177 [Triparma verrucosa]